MDGPERSRVRGHLWFCGVYMSFELKSLATALSASTEG